MTDVLPPSHQGNISSKDIRPPFYWLVFVALTLWGLSAGFLFWQHTDTTERFLRATDYFYTVSDNAEHMRNEALELKRNIESENRHPGFRRGLVQRQYFIEKLLAETGQIEARFGRSDAPFRRLEQAYVKFNQALDAIGEGAVDSDNVTEGISAFIGRLDQYVKLRDAQHDEDQLKGQEASSQSRVYVFAILMLVLLIGTLSVFRTWQQIRRIVEKGRAAAGALAESQDRYRDFAELSSDRFWEMDKDLRFTSLTHLTGDNSHLEPNDVIGKTRWEVAGADLDKDEKWRRHRDALMARKPFRNTVLNYPREDGSDLYLSVSGYALIDDKGNFSGYRGTANDVTSRMAAEEALATSEARLNEAQRITSTGSWELDVQSGALTWSDEIFRIFEINPKIFGASYEAFLKTIHPDDVDAVNQAYTGSLTDRKPYEITHRLLMEDGRVKWVRESCETSFGDDGTPLISIGTVQDISILKKTEETLRESESRFRAIAESIMVPTVITRKSDGAILFANPATEDIAGIPAEKLLGRTATQNWVNPDDRDRFLAQIAAKGRVEVMEVLTRHPDDKQLRNTLVSAQEINYQDEPSIISTFFDVTDHREAEKSARESDERFSKVMAIAPDAIIAVDGKFRIQIFNKGAEKIFGHPGSEVIGQSLDILLPARFRHHHDQHITRFLNSLDDSRLMSSRSEIFGLKKDGSEFPAEASISKLRVGDEVMLTVLLHDVSERKKVEAELLAAKNRAEYADRAKSEFLANMSHELRTPLNAIIGFSQMMQRQTFGPLGDDRYDEYSRSIFESGDHLLSLINDILDISKIEAGQAELREEEVEVSRMIEDCARLIKIRSYEAGLKMDMQIEPDLPFLLVDERMIKQVLLNLLSNAVKFTQRGGSIAISCKRIQEGDLQVSISDTGIGIAEEDIPKAMSTFGQVDGSLGRAFEGTGLGLPLARSMVELHGGKFDLQSVLGTGTTVTVTLPAERLMEDRLVHQ